MKFAVSGTHATGKSTLMHALTSLLAGYEAVEEPYYLMAEDGYDFADEPTLDDYVAQMKYSMAMIAGSEDDTIFERAPLDFLAYLNAHDEGATFEEESWSEMVEETMDMLDFVVFVPVETPDVIGLAFENDRALRERVNHALQELMDEFEFSGGGRVVTVSGSVEERARQVLSFMDTLHR